MEIQHLTEKYIQDRDSYLRSTYNEMQLRNDFIDPLLKILGWDVDNDKGKAQFLRDVVQEEYIEVEGELAKKNPDYTLRISGARQLFVEVKKPSVDILKSAEAAFQTRRYGWSANLGISVLTNFEHIVIYDCRFKPDLGDSAQVARYRVFSYDEYVQSFDELSHLLSYDAINAGAVNEEFPMDDRKGEKFDEYFLQQIEQWREKLAISAIKENGGLTDEDINFFVQRLLNRIVFLRICEDRAIEKFETLKRVKSYEDLKQLFSASDKKFNSGLFDFIEDNLSLSLNVDAGVLIGIFSELYFPNSPYDFSVVDPTILSQVYERFLAKRIAVEGGQAIYVLEAPEVSASSGVVPTPRIIAKQIVKDTLMPVINRKSFEQLFAIRVADICCGSGTFLISAYDFLVEKILEKAAEEKVNNKKLVLQEDNSVIALTLKAKREIMERTVYGVDIDPYAIEVSKFSLLLKLLEGETAASIDEFISTYSEKALPSLEKNVKCGNSLVDSLFFDFMPEALDDDQVLYKVRPFDWEEEFPFLANSNGFDAIIGNPPYVRIQNLRKYFPEEIKYYQSSVSGYEVARKANIDKYFVFIQRAVELLNQEGRLGYIIPHKFFLTQSGKALREYIVENCQVSRIIHFGSSQVFPERSTYTAILIIQKQKEAAFDFRRVKEISIETLMDEKGYIRYQSSSLGPEPWIFLSPETELVFDKLKEQSIPLNKLADIAVGLQTSADNIFIFEPESETGTTFKFIKNGKRYEVEKGVCVPALYRVSFDLFDTVGANAQMIFPYVVQGDTAILLNEADFQSKFPLTWKYLIEYKAVLQKRNLQGSHARWYQFGRSQSLTRFHNVEKLIWSVLAKSPPYAFDSNNLHFTGGGNGPYYSLINKSKYSLLYFLGILAHPLIECMVKSRASEFRGAYYSHGKQFIETIPIRVIDFKKPDEVVLYGNIVKTVESLISNKSKLRGATRRSIKEVLIRKEKWLYNRLVVLINNLYQITDDDFFAVINDEMLVTEVEVEE